MAAQPPHQTTVNVTTTEAPAETIIAGFSAYGLAGLTAADYLVTQLGLEETGYVTINALPTITPFADGSPRHHTRLYSRSDLDVTVLVNELLVPRWAADPFASAVVEWLHEHGVNEISLLFGIPVVHQPGEHDVFFVATDDYRTHRLAETDFAPMGRGFLEGINASLIDHGMDTSLRVGLLSTPVHEEVPDVEAAIRLVEAVDTLYELNVDTSELEAFAVEIEEYYQELSERVKADETTQSPADGMFM